jgi:hypothetical protein
VACSDYTRLARDSPESTRSGGSVRAPLAQALGNRLGPAVTFATTEDFNLQTARAATVSEANGRASIYLAALSSNLIALAFIGQMSRLGAAFYAFALILLPVLAFVGAVTFQRLVQSSIEDIAYAQRIARLRAFYLRLAPELEPYLLAVREPSTEALSHHERLRPSAWQLTLTTAGMVAAVNGPVIGACAGLAVAALPIGSLVVVLAVGATARGSDPVDTAPPPPTGGRGLQTRRHRPDRDLHPGNRAGRAVTTGICQGERTARRTIQGP